MIERLRLRPARRHFVVRSWLWTTLLLLLFVWWTKTLTTTYAVTLTTGHGCGVTIFTTGFARLPLVVQRCVRFHEACHLVQGARFPLDGGAAERAAWEATRAYVRFLQDRCTERCRAKDPEALGELRDLVAYDLEVVEAALLVYR